MASPTWSPPISEEPPIPARRPTIAVGILAASVALATSMVLLVDRDITLPDRHGAERLVDAFLTDMAEGEWDSAHDRFDHSCVDFSVGAYRSAFEPVLDGYRGHRVVPVHEATETDPGEILLVRGFVHLSPGGDHSFRAELVDEGTPAAPSWVLCGFRIDAP